MSEPSRKSWRRWPTVALLHVTGACAGTVTSAKGVFFPSLIKAFGLSHTAGSALLSANTILGGVVSLLCGWFFLRRMRAETFFAITTALIGVGYILAGFAQSYLYLLAAYLLMAGAGSHLVVTPFVCANWFKNKRGVATGLALAGSTTGGVVFTPLMTWVVGHFGWRVGYESLGWGILLILPVLLLVVVRTAPEEEVQQASQGEGTIHAWGMRPSEAFRTPLFWVILLGYFVFWASTAAYFLHFLPALADIGFKPGDAVTAMSILFLLAGITKAIFGYISDRIEVRPALILALALSAVGMILLSLFYLHIAQGTFLTAFILIYGFAYSAPLVLFPVYVSQSFGRAYFTAIDSTVMVVGSVAGSLGGVFAGFMFDHTGTYQSAFLVLGIALFISTGLILAVGGRRKSILRAQVA